MIDYGSGQVLCDRCGRDCRATDEHPSFDEQYANPLQGDLLYVGAYGSTRADLELWKAELCEDCMFAVRSFIDAGPSESEQAAGRPNAGRGVTVVENVMLEEAAFGLVNGYTNGDELLPRGFDKAEEERRREEFQRWLERKYKITLPR